jgi:hypothetical protein
MKNIKKIVDDLHRAKNDPNFEAFIAEQFLSIKDSKEEPCFTFSNKDATFDVWKKSDNDYSLVKSVLPGSKKAGKDFKKDMKKNEIVEEILKIVGNFLDEA